MGALLDRGRARDGASRRLDVTDANANPGRVPRPAWRSPGAWATLVIVIVLGLSSDLGSKWLAFEHVPSSPAHVTRAEVLSADNLGHLIPRHEPATVVPYLLEFTLVLNPGAVFGIGAGQRWFFITFSLLALGFATWVFAAWTTPKDRWIHAGIGLIIAGGLGNLYDRLVFACVRDFIHPLPNVHLPFGISWPGGETEVWPWVSNAADLYLIIGIGALLVYSWRKPDDGPPEGGSSQEPTAGRAPDQTPS